MSTPKAQLLDTHKSNTPPLSIRKRWLSICERISIVTKCDEKSSEERKKKLKFILLVWRCHIYFAKIVIARTENCRQLMSTYFDDGFCFALKKQKNHSTLSSKVFNIIYHFQYSLRFVAFFMRLFRNLNQNINVI